MKNEQTNNVSTRNFLFMRAPPSVKPKTWNTQTRNVPETQRTVLIPIATNQELSARASANLIFLLWVNSLEQNLGRTEEDRKDEKIPKSRNTENQRILRGTPKSSR